MLCTINTDASFHPLYKVGAYAFWIVCNEFKIQKAGFFRDFSENSTDAEMKCIVNAIHTALEKKTKITKIIINTDSLHSINYFSNRKPKNPIMKKVRRQFLKIKNEKARGIEIEFRHVKAHTGKNDARSYVNEWCDTHAKRFLWKRIHELKLIKNER